MQHLPPHGEHGRVIREEGHVGGEEVTGADWIRKRVVGLDLLGQILRQSRAGSFSA